MPTLITCPVVRARGISVGRYNLKKKNRPSLIVDVGKC